MAMESPERQKIKAILPPAKECTHTLHYCEENVWLLCQHVQDKYPQELPYCYAVFISNQNQTVPLWRQRAGRTEDRVVIWVGHDDNITGRVATGRHRGRSRDYTDSITGRHL
ncbi:protein N-terminal glutamine amidohydrolase-like, partial [Amphibalanus amphitrite]|uniref:protein N-terminal glutamine amidohydrolase-like n=1 Tax=Amphibalanus amphitrite TaxID=1232801 RepID=UPI001C912437